MRGLLLELVWFDESIIELALSVSNGTYSAKANFYVPIDELDELAQKLNGFPLSSVDAREFEFSTPDMPGYGGATLKISPRGVFGRVLVTANVFTKKMNEYKDLDMATIHFLANLSDIDSFLNDVNVMSKNLNGSALIPAELQS